MAVSVTTVASVSEMELSIQDMVVNKCGSDEDGGKCGDGGECSRYEAKCIRHGGK